MMMTRFTLFTGPGASGFHGHFGSLVLAQEAAAQLTQPWTVVRQRCREAPSVCNADRGLPSIEVMSSVVVDVGPTPEQPAPGLVRYLLLGQVFDLSPDLARATGLEGPRVDDRTLADIAQALSEGVYGVAAILRAAALRNARITASELRSAGSGA